MRDACRVLAYVRTETALVAVRRSERCVATTLVPPGNARIPQWEYVASRRRRFDAATLAALDGAREVARRSGGEVRVVDLARAHPLLRLLWAARGGGPLPVVVLKGRCTWPKDGGEGSPAPVGARRDSGRRSIA